MNTRRDFLKIAIAACGGAVVAGCGGGGGAMDMASGGDCLANGTSVLISSNHGHAMTVSKADINAGVAKTYDIMAQADHTHSVTVSAADFAKLKINQSVQVTTTSTLGHTHPVIVTCA